MSYETDSDSESISPQTEAGKWLARLQGSQSREKTWRKAAAAAVKLYESECTPQERPYNILYATTDTLAPALYNYLPRPIVKPRFVQKQQPIAQMAAIVAQRLIQFSLDYADSESNDFDEGMRYAVLQALVPGRGQLRVRWTAKTQEPAEAVNEEASAKEGAEKKAEIDQTPEVTDDQLQYEMVPWDQFLHGYGENWSKVPWVAFCHFWSRAEIEKRYGPKTAERLFGTKSEGQDNSCASIYAAPQETTNEQSLNKAPSNVHKDDAEVWEIWDKINRKVIFVTTKDSSEVLQTEDDPLQLKGFFPCPRPILLYRRVKGMTPQMLYEAYRSQAEELNVITARLKKIVSALRVRGYYNAAVSELERVFAADDTIMVPIQDTSAITGQGMKLDDAIWLMPLDQLAGAADKLMIQRNQIKQIIFELTGIADIMRGSSQASETLGAQQLKAQWGTLRLKSMQHESNRFARDMLRLGLEVMVTYFPPELVREVTGIPLMTSAEKAQMQAQVQQMQMQMTAQGPQQPGQPPMQPDPQMAQQLEQAQRMLQAPSMDEVLNMLKTDTLRTFNISIDTSSTLESETTEDKKDMSELLNAMSQFLNGITPLVESQALPMESAKILLLNLLRKFRMGTEVEEAIMQMQEPPQKQNDPEQEKQLQEAQKQIQQAQQKLQQEQQQLEQAKAEFDLKQKEAVRELALERQMAMREVQMERQFAMREVQMEKQMSSRELQQQATLAESKVRDMIAAQNAANQPNETPPTEGA